MSSAPEKWQTGQSVAARYPGQRHDPPPERIRLPPLTSFVSKASSVERPGGPGKERPDPFLPYAVQHDRESEAALPPYQPGMGTSYMAVNPTSYRPPSTAVHAQHRRDRAVAAPSFSSSTNHSQPLMEYGAVPTAAYPAHTSPMYNPQDARRVSADANRVSRPRKVAIPFTPESLRGTGGRAKGDTVLRLPNPTEAGQSSDAARPPMRQAPAMPPGPVLPEALPDEYTIRMRQQPVAARSCGFGDRDRRVIDPPPIIELIINNPSLSPEEQSARLRYPYYVVHCTIYDKDGEHDCTFMPGSYRPQKRLIGSLTAGSFVGKDEFGNEGCFFPFSDLSVRTPGEFRLKFSFVILEPHRGRSGKSYGIRSTTFSSVVVASPAKEFQGMLRSSPLVRSLRKQGCFIGVKKGGSEDGNKLPKARGNRDGSDDSEGSSTSSPPKKRSRQAGRGHKTKS